MQILDYNRTRAFTAIAEGILSAGQLVGQGTLSGSVRLANATGGAIQPMGVVAATVANGERVLVLPECTVYDTALFQAAAGLRLYLVAGGVIDYVPLSIVDDIRPVVGFMLRTSCAQLDINPVATKVVLAAAATSAFA